jgi:hypothetical protein
VSRFALASPKAITLAFVLAASSILSADALRAEDAAKEQLRKEIREKKGIDATRWGEDIRNPFTNLTAEGKAKLKKQGVDVERLVKRRAVLLTGVYSGANRKPFVNRDPDTILVLGKDFVTHGRVYSLGPVLAVENAAVMRRLTGADLVWFVEEAELSDWTRGSPLLVSSKAWQDVDPDTQKALRHGDYGWRRPEDFLKFPPLKAGAKLPPLAASDAEKKKKDLQRLILSRRGEDVAACGEEVVNPFKGLTEKGRANWLPAASTRGGCASSRPFCSRGMRVATTAESSLTATRTPSSSSARILTPMCRFSVWGRCWPSRTPISWAMSTGRTWYGSWTRRLRAAARQACR